MNQRWGNTRLYSWKLTNLAGRTPSLISWRNRIPPQWDGRIPRRNDRYSTLKGKPGGSWFGSWDTESMSQSDRFCHLSQNSAAFFCTWLTWFEPRFFIIMFLSFSPSCHQLGTVLLWPFFYVRERVLRSRFCQLQDSFFAFFLSSLSFYGGWKVHPIWFFCFRPGCDDDDDDDVKSNEQNGRHHGLVWCGVCSLGGSLMWSLLFLGHSFECGVCFLRPRFDVKFVLWGKFWCGVCFYLGTVWCGVCSLGPSFMWSLLVWCPIRCGVCFYLAAVWCRVIFLGAQFDVEFVFWRAVWAVPLWRNWDSGTRNQVSHTDFVQSPQPFTTDGGTLLVCLPACLPDSLTHLLSHARRKQACTWQRPSERAWLPGRGTWEKDYAEPNWRMRTCAFSRGQQMSDDYHDDVCCYSLQRVLLHTQYT